MLLDVLSSDTVQIKHDIHVSDLNPWLIHTYIQVQQHVEPLIHALGVLCDKLYSVDTLKLPTDTPKKRTRIVPPSALDEACALSREHVYYWARAEYNRIIAQDADALTMAEQLQVATLFIFLNKCGFRGIYRVNRSGEMNVPYGNYAKSLRIFHEDHLREISNVLQPVQFHCESFESAMQRVQPRSLIYVDPPYLKVNPKTSFVQYTAEGFGEKQTNDLIQRCKDIHLTGTRVVLSNADVPDLRVHFTDSECFDCYTVQCRRAIHSKNPSAMCSEVICVSK